jgi:hypothetical protein
MWVGYLGWPEHRLSERQKMRVPFLLLPILAAAALGLSACSGGGSATPPADSAAEPSGPDTCGMAPLRQHIGEILDVTMLQSFENIVPSHRVRVIAPHTAVTDDVVPERANVKTDRYSTILSIYCG